MFDKKDSLFVVAAWIEGNLEYADRRYIAISSANRLFLFSSRYGVVSGSKHSNITMPFSSCTIPFKFEED